MSTLTIRLFGGFQIAHEAWERELKVTRSVQNLLAFLLVERHRLHPREVLAGLFWGDHSEEQARSCLSTVLWRLRRLLEPQNIPKGTYLVTTLAEVGFNSESDHWLDVAVFEDQVGPVLKKPSRAMEADEACRLKNAIDLHMGELLEGFYDDWALRERERLRSLYLKSLAHLMRYYQHHGLYENAITCGLQILNHDPLREEIHREVIRLYLKNGQRALAMRQYKACCQILEDELGIPPMEETQALYTEIVEPSGPQRRKSALLQAQGIATSKDPASLEQAFQKFHEAMQHFDKTREEFQRAIRLLETITKR